MSQPRHRWRLAAFRALQTLYPRWFREMHGEEMTDFFAARLRRTDKRRTGLRLWSWVLQDAAKTAVALRRSGWHGRGSDGRSITMDTLLQDIRHAVRHLARAPVFTVGAVALLAVGIGANTTVFTVVDSLLFRPMPWANPEEVVYVYQDSDDGEPNSTSFPAYRDMAANEVFAYVGATTPASLVWEASDGPVSVDIEFTTAAWLDVLGLSPDRGRWFGSEHDIVGSETVAVVSYPTWETRFGSDPSIIGRTLRFNGHPVTIIGVGPQGLPGSFPPLLTDFWLSISSVAAGGDFRVGNLERREDHWYDVRARLAPGTSVQQAQGAMDALATRLAEEFPELNRGRDITVFASGDIRVHPQGDGMLFAGGTLLTVIVGLVLLLACANLANLLLVRGMGRTGEMAVRRALGAGRGRVARLFLLESMTLSIVGGGLGFLLARSALRVVPTLPIPMPGVIELGMDYRVGLYSVLLVVVTGVLFGLAPALRIARDDVARSLRDESRTTSLGRGAKRLRGALVAVQVGASLVLVLGTGLVARSLAAVQGADTGIDVDRVAYVRTDFSQVGLTGEEGRVALDELQMRLGALPGVTAVGAAHRLPASRGGSTTTVVEDYTPPAGTDAVELDYAIVTDTYFETLGIPLVEGRMFNDDDMLGGPTVVLVNETAARRFWGSVDVVGRRLRSQTAETWRTVIGVVGDSPVASVAEDVRPVFYFSETQASLSTPYLFIRSETDPAGLIPAMRQELAGMRPALTVASQGTLASHFGESLATPRLAATLMGAFSLLAVFLAGLGIYAVVSFSVARRSGELGIRMALGAERGRVLRSVVGEVVGTVALGLVGGLLLSALVAPRLAGVLYGVTPLDPVTFIGSVVFLALVAWLAAYVPARRALEVDPVVALRAD